VDVDNAFNGLPAMNGLLPPQPQSKQLGHITPVFGYLPDPPPPPKTSANLHCFLCCLFDMEMEIVRKFGGIPI
jgi:hypothetical protein